MDRQEPIEDRVLDYYMAQIEGGFLLPGDLLPSYKEASVKWHCTTSTISRVYYALRVLRYITGRLGYGMIVTKPELRWRQPLKY